MGRFPAVLKIPHAVGNIGEVAHHTPFLLSNYQTDVRPTEKAGRCAMLCRPVFRLRTFAAVWRIVWLLPRWTARGVANPLATPKFSEMREEGRQPVIARRKLRVSHRDGVPTTPLRCRKPHRQRRDIFGSARLCAVPFDLLTQACLLYDSLSSWVA